MANRPNDNSTPAGPTPDQPRDDDSEGDVDAFYEDSWDALPDGEWTDVSDQSDAEGDEPTAGMSNAVWHAPRGPRTRIISIILLVFMAVSVLTLAVMAIWSLVT